jgi:YD repeat-containing protein
LDVCTVSTTDTLGRVTGTVFDQRGQITAELHADGTETSHTYSGDGYQLSTKYADRTVTYAVDELGNRTSMTDQLGTSKWKFDWANRVVSDTDAKGNTHTYTYDAVGNQTQAALSDGRVLDRVFDGRGLAVSQKAISQDGSDGVTEFGYDADGNLTEIARPSGVVTTTSFDLVGRVTTIAHSGNVPEGFEGDPADAPHAPGNAYGHCNEAPGHVNQQPTGCWTNDLELSYEYDDRGLIVSRAVATDVTVTDTVYDHDALGRLTESVTEGVTSTYGWDAASNLVSESVSDDVTTNLADDGWEVTRTVNAANQVTSVVTDVRLPDVHTTIDTFTYDQRGNRTGSVTKRTTGGKTHTLARTDYRFDAMDQVTFVRDHGDNLNNAKDDTVTGWARDGLGRALTVTENGDTKQRVFDGTALVVDGDTRITRAPNGTVLNEAFETVEGKGKNATTVTVSRDVLNDVLNSAIAVAEDGVIDADLVFFTDFGEELFTPERVTVTGFTGRTDAARLTEFETRAYDPASRVWVQEDMYAGTVTRASSMNRYTYVEGARDWP